MNRKIPILLAALFLMSVSAFATQWTLNMHQKEDPAIVVSYTFNREPVITYLDNNRGVLVTLESPHEEIEYQFDGLAFITLCEGEPTAVSRVTADGDTSNADIYIYTIDGFLVRMVKAGQGNGSISLEDLPSGIYVVKCGNISHKILKR